MKGFSFLELLVSIAMISILASMSMLTFDEYKDKADSAAALSGLRNILFAVTALELDTGESPGGNDIEPCVTIESGNEMPVNDCSAGLLCNDGTFSNWTGPYISEPETLDPWGTPYQYDIDYICTSTITGCNQSGWARAINSAGTDKILNNYDPSEVALVICYR